MPFSDTIIILANLGGPRHLSDIESFLLSLLGDRYVIRLPWWLRWYQPMLARTIVKKRLAKSTKLYSEIGNGSPIQAISEMQAYFLEKKLHHVSVYVVMRHSHPDIQDLLTAIADKPIKKAVVIPLYPHYSTTTTLSSYEQISTVLGKERPEITISYVDSYPTHPLYIQSWCQMIDYQVSRHNLDDGQPLEIIYSAHSIPSDYVTKYADPYLGQITACYQAIASHYPQYKHTLTFQSRFGRGEWLGPMMDDYLESLSRGARVLVVPISFVSEHVETIHEIGIQFREIADARGINMYQVQAPGCLPAYIECLKCLALSAL